MKGIIFLLLVILTSIPHANALSVVSDYLANDTLELISGNSKIYSIRLQNPTDGEVGIKLDYDSAFMRVTDYKELYVLPPKTTGYRIEFNVTAPKEPGLHRVGYTVSEVESGGEGLAIRLKINKNFNLKVTEKPNKFHLNFNYVIYAAMIIVFLIYVFRKKRIEKRSKRKSRRFL